MEMLDMRQKKAATKELKARYNKATMTFPPKTSAI